jgi:flagellar biosynthesis/type III secretory pathway chaperone
MTESLSRLIAALREELQSYGALLALLDQQQEQVTSRAAEALRASVTAIQEQATALHEARAERDGCRRDLALEFQVPEDAPFGLLIPLVPADYQPLLEALVKENNELLVRVRQRARQNHVLLSRSVELMQQFIGSLWPGQETFTYTDAGRGRAGARASSAVFNAVG